MLTPHQHSILNALEQAVTSNKDAINHTNSPHTDTAEAYKELAEQSQKLAETTARYARFIGIPEQEIIPLTRGIV